MVQSIRHRVLLALIGAALIPSILILCVTNRITGEALKKSEYATIQGVGSEIARQVAASMEASRSSLETLQSNPILVAPDVELAKRVEEMGRLVNAYQRFTDITIYFPDGGMLKSPTRL